MRLIALLIAALTIVSGAFAVDVQKSFIVSYQDDTPDSVVTEAKNKIINAGGVITHEYQIIKGFAATAGEKTFETVQALFSKFNAQVEEDQVVSINQ